MTSNFNLKADIRKSLGSTDAKRARKSGQVPAVIYGKKAENLNIAVDAKEFERQYFKGNIFTSIVEIELDGKKIQAIPHKIEFHPITDRPIHIDFIQFDKSEKVKVQTKINFVNKDKSTGIKRGGFLHINFRKIEVICLADAIPHEIEFDLTGLIMGSKIRSEDLKLPAGVELAKKGTFTIASIIGRGAKDAAEDKPAAEGEAAAEGEEAAKEGEEEKKDEEKK